MYYTEAEAAAGKVGRWWRWRWHRWDGGGGSTGPRQWRWRRCTVAYRGGGELQKSVILAILRIPTSRPRPTTRFGISATAMTIVDVGRQWRI